MGIRMALGAQPDDILCHVVSHMAFLVTLGMAVGLAAAYGLSRLLGSMFYEVGSADPRAFAGASILLGAVAALAAYLP
jgi:ABC-type antimicrobial peptide transport system permease subunit